jgi:uncharacterized protein (TIRG00374 family)
MKQSRTTNTQLTKQGDSIQISVLSVSLTVVAAVVFYSAVTIFLDLKGFDAAVSTLPGTVWIQALGLSLLSYLLRFVRWQYFIFSLGHRVPAMRSLEIYLAGFALTLIPGKAGETVRSVYLHPYGVSYPRSIGAFVSERLLDLAAVGAMTSSALWMFQEQRSWLLAVIVGTMMLALTFRSRLPTLIGKRLTRGSVVRYATKAAVVVRFLLSGRRLALATTLSLVAWIAQGIALHLIVHELGYELSASTTVGIYCLGILVGSASFIPGGLGATEAALVLFLSLAGVGQTDAIVASMISRGLTLWLAVGIGVAAMTKTALTDQRHTSTTHTPP